MDNNKEWMEVVREVLICYCGEFFFLVVEKLEGFYLYIIDGRVILDFILG